MNKNYYAILMAGGVGSRFWPVSTENNPKQFHDMLGTGHESGADTVRTAPGLDRGRDPEEGEGTPLQQTCRLL